MKDAYSTHMDQTIRLMFQDEAGFGRINKPKMCWCPKGVRPSVPCHHIREYEYLYGAVEPMTGENFFLIMPYCNTNHMNAFLRELSAAYPKDYILLVTDGAAWHSAKALVVPENIKPLRIPPYTPEMNPIEQIWKYLRSVGFRNEIFRSLADVVDRLCEIVTALTTGIVSCITCREWIKFCFLD